MKDFEFLVAEEYKLENWAEWMKKQYSMELSDCQVFDAGNSNRKFFHRKMFRTWEFFDAGSFGREIASSFG